jgi:hypothetical protein
MTMHVDVKAAQAFHAASKEVRQKLEALFHLRLLEVTEESGSARLVTQSKPGQAFSSALP